MVIKDYTYFVFKVQEKKCYAPSFLKAKSALSYILHKRFNFMLTLKANPVQFSAFAL